MKMESNRKVYEVKIEHGKNKVRGGRHVFINTKIVLNKEDASAVLVYKAVIRSKQGKYRYLKEKSKSVEESEATPLNALVYMIHMIYRDAVIEKSLKKTDTVTVMVDSKINETVLNILNNAKQGQKVFKTVSKLEPSERSVYIGLINSIQKTSKRSGVILKFKYQKQYMNQIIENTGKENYAKRKQSYILSNVKNRTAAEKEALRLRYKVQNKYDYDDLINR